MSEPGSLARALVLLQAELPHIMRRTEGQAGPRRYKYADLPDVTDKLMPRLAALGLTFTACPTLIMLGNEPKFVLEYRLEHAPTGEHRGGMYPLGTGNPQQLGSAITYARRYCLCSVTGVAPDEDDDDGQAAGRDDGLPVNADGSLSRSRTTDAEKDAAGVMTSAQQAEHTALGGGPAGRRTTAAERAKSTHLAAVPEGDAWYTGPAVPAEAEDNPGTITKGRGSQQAAMHAKFTELGIRDREERLNITRVLLGIDFLASSDELSYRQAGDLLERLASADPADRMAIEAARRGVRA